MNKEFIKVRTITDITISSILLISGIIIVALPTSVSVNIFGFFAFIIGVLLLAILKTGWLDIETKERYCLKHRYFPKNRKNEILNALENNIDSIDISDEDNEGLRVDIYYNKQNHKAFIDLFEYVPYNYERIAPTVEYTIDKIKKLLG